jgi:outer membrane lipase/esterase
VAYTWGGEFVKLKETLLACAALLGSAQFAAAQNFNQTIVFGDSTEDAGWFAHFATGNPAFDNAIQAALAAGGNAHFTGPGPNYTQILASKFGTTANEVNGPGGGTNFAIGGAFDNGTFDALFGPGHQNLATLGTPGNTGLPGTAEQIGNYLASTGGKANPNALYLIASGGNDIFASLELAAVNPVFFTPAVINAILLSEAQALAISVAQLQAAGARTIVVGDEYPIAPIATAPGQNALGLTLFTATWADLAAAGVKFIPADTASVIAAVQANPFAFGITAPINSPACVISPGLAAATGLTTGYGALCAPTTTPNPAYGNLVSADALQTHLFMDFVHLTQAGEIITADYIYSLLSAPSQISFLAESAIQTTLSMIYGIQQQIDISQRKPAGWNVWVNGDLSYLQINNSISGLPNDPGTPVSGTLGVDYHWTNGWLVGAAVTEGYVTPTFSLGGGFTQNTAALSVYAGYRDAQWWGNLIGSVGFLADTTNRQVPIGITVQPNNGSTDGTDFSLAGEVGYDIHSGFITHGPVGGFILQTARIAGFTESGSFTSLSFGTQVRNSEVSVLGWQAYTDWGIWHPFAQVVWDHEFDPLNRMVTASLTTIAAPSFSLPAVVTGRDWATATVGTQVKLSQNWTALASFTAQVGEQNVTNLGGLIGLNYAFYQEPAAPIVHK